MPWRLPPATTVAVAAALALVGNLATNTVKVNPAWVPALWVAAGLLIVVSVILDNRARSTMLPVPPVEDVDRIADQLAQAVRGQWQREEEHRRVADPVALPVRWHVVGSDVVDHWTNICLTLPGLDATPPVLSGHLAQIAEIYARVPSGRLVILGQGGAGKTVLVARLALDLLAIRAEGGRVPVIISIGSWNPETTPLREWLVTQLVRDHPALAGKVNGSDKATALLTADRILPILDGFDEINPGFHSAALRQLNTVTGIPLVLTSRPEEYIAAVRDVDVLTNAAGIELEDLCLDDLVEYLPRTTCRGLGSGRGVWAPVLDRLCDSRPDPAAVVLSRVLTTPLMVYLARTIYSDSPGYDPGDLLNTRRFSTREALEEYLLAAYLPAVYQHPAPATGRMRGPDGPTRWLTYLALHLNQLGTRDFAWWQLRDTVPRVKRILAYGLFSMLVMEIALWLFSAWSSYDTFAIRLGRLTAIATIVAFLAGVMCGIARTGPNPVRIRFRVRGQARKFLRYGGLGLDTGMIGSAAIQSASWLRDPILLGLSVALLFSVALSFSVRLGSATTTERSMRAYVSPRIFAGIRNALRYVLFAYMLLSVGLYIGRSDSFEGIYLDVYFLYLAVPLGAGLLSIGLAVVFSAPIDMTTTVSASESLAADRNHAILQVIVVTLVLGLVASVAYSLMIISSTQFEYLIILDLVIGLITGLRRAWGQWFVLARLWLPLTGRLPWTAEGFISDAYRRGVLRQAGGVYQFRHARLQDHLAHHALNQHSGLLPRKEPGIEQPHDRQQSFNPDAGRS